ncbi:MAG: tyrosine--tRNA ligase [Phenylobacterium sp.]|uniref:tyrosine--tRNA ligase n=1 Tax=Phenylobacterium sp. TaxID=1871053 RepID=UPI00121B6DF4|nr:tyrosine--tRNA ligase [Phenylobacterium sp.]TAJ70565.1 MAG: tyrosine--tRNA ligase [Phenylobacterium sp.]
MTETAFTSDFLKVLQERGYIHQVTHPAELDEAATKGVITAYIGFDATAPSLHVGSLIQIMMLRRLQQTGHKPIVLMGGGTTKIGDPTDKDQSRPLLTEAQIQANIASIKTVFAKFLTFGDGPTDAIMVDNDAWLSKYGYVDFLREFGVHFTVNRMLAFDSVKARLEREQPMTFLEFNYMLMQSVDFLELERRNGCLLQMGGSDQWGNIVNGVELIRRVDQKPAFGLTTPLLSTASGQKMGKTVGGAVWLNADMRSPYDYWQFWRNTEDADVGRFLKLFTDLPLDEIARLEALPGAEINEAKVILAREATTMLHGIDDALASELTARLAFKDGVTDASLPTVEVARDQFPVHRTTAGLVVEAGLAKSLGEARRLIAGGGVSINDRRALADEKHGYDQLLPELNAFKVQVGKKKIVLVKPV